MRSCLPLLLLLAAVPGAAQSIGLRFGAPEAPSHAGPRIRAGRWLPGVWGWGWGAGWSNPGPLRVIVEKAPEKEKPAPAYVNNKEYVSERLSPRMTEVTAAAHTPAPVHWQPCDLRLLGGEAFSAAQCAEVDDSLLVRTETGRRYRFSRDLVAAITPRN